MNNNDTNNVNTNEQVTPTIKIVENNGAQTNSLNTQVNQNINTPNVQTNVNTAPPVINITPVSNNGSVNSNTNPNPTPSVTITPVTPEPPQNPNNGDEEEPKGAKGRRILIFVFMIFAIIFVFFLPQISAYFNGTRPVSTSNNEVQNGTLLCSREYKADTSNKEYEYRISFRNKGITTGIYTTTYEDEDENNIDKENGKCKEISAISETINGIDVNCSSSDNVATTIQNNTYKDIDLGKLTAFTEAGGIYPEYKYKDNPYDVQARLIKDGFDCDISAD